ncbi:MAG: hypothetical protein FWD61_14655 [Phycisphaerales bacterium]|nr:hypothetical protein [Phycisphaerales bacterium]
MKTKMPICRKKSGKGKAGTFASFWMGGFESACQVNTKGVRIDMQAATQHDVMAREDYEMMKGQGIRVVRDGAVWPSVERARGVYDWSRFVGMVRAAEAAGVQVIWNLLHYGWPEDIDILSGEFVERFVKFCGAAARIVKEESSRASVYVPVNEISFLAWAMGTKGIIQPVMLGRAMEIKKQLVRASIGAMEAIWEVDGRARFMHVDPIIHVMPPQGRLDMAEQAAGQRRAQFDGWDMLCGRMCPELGGAMKYLDMVGVNYYHSNQFEAPDVRLRWEDEPRDERFVPLWVLLEEVYGRYGRSLVIAETSHFGVGRGKWIREIGQQVIEARRRGVPLEGVCLYPIIDRPDWEDMEQWHNSGLWDLKWVGGRWERVLCGEYAEALRESQRELAAIGCS